MAFMSDNIVTIYKYTEVDFLLNNDIKKIGGAMALLWATILLFQCYYNYDIMLVMLCCLLLWEANVLTREHCYIILHLFT